MKYLILVALFALAAAQDRRYPIYDRPCSVRSEIIRPQVKTAFNVAAVSIQTQWILWWRFSDCYAILQYSGTWFEIGRYQQQDEPEADCLSSLYSWGFISRSFQINRNGHDFNDNQPFTRQANALLAFPDANPVLGLLNVTYYADRGL